MWPKRSIKISPTEVEMGARYARRRFAIDGVLVYQILCQVGESFEDYVLYYDILSFLCP